MKLNNTPEIIEDIRQGKMVVIMDDEDRENEGDLVMAASAIDADAINFMARYGRGLICLTLTRERCQMLNLPLMARNTHTNTTTNFTVSIEAAEGVTTGISAADRALTIQRAVANNASPTDLVQPGHVFPIMALPGGVLSRAGHTEAGCDLARLAGLDPFAVIVEILKEDGTMARRPDLEVFAKEHDLKLGTIADLIHFRTEHEKTVQRVADNNLSTEFGEFRLIAFEDTIQNDLHLALIKGQIKPEEPILVRVHIHNPIYDLTASIRNDTGWLLRDVLERVATESNALVLILCNQFTSDDLVQQIQNYDPASTHQPENTKHQSSKKDLRTYGLGAQILSDLGVRKMRVLSAPKKIHAISGFGLEVVEYID